MNQEQENKMKEDYAREVDNMIDCVVASSVLPLIEEQISTTTGTPYKYDGNKADLYKKILDMKFEEEDDSNPRTTALKKLIQRDAEYIVKTKNSEIKIRSLNCAMPLGMGPLSKDEELDEGADVLVEDKIKSVREILLKDESSLEVGELLKIMECCEEMRRILTAVEKRKGKNEES